MARFALSAILSIAAALPAAAEGPDFAKEVAPILEASCVKCHCEAKTKGKLRMDTKEMAMKPRKDGNLIVPGKPDESAMIKALLLPEDNDEAMPPKDKAPRPTAEQIEILKKWIAAGAAWPDDAKLKAKE